MTSGALNVTTIAVVLILFLGGCATGNAYWSLGVGGELETTDNGYVFEGEVALSGHYGPIEVENVRILLLDDDRAVMGTVDIGAVNETRDRIRFNATIDNPPAFVIMKTGEIESPDNAEFDISPGLKRVEGGEYERLQSQVHTNSTE